MRKFKLTSLVVLCVTLGSIGLATAQTAPAPPPSITTQDKVNTRFGTFEFKDGAPSKNTLNKAYDYIDFTHAYNAFVNTMQGVSLVAARKGFLDAGVKDNEILIFSELMDAKSLFLTANADTVYFLGFIDVSKGPMVFEVPPKVLGALDDMWFRWVTDFGLPGPDRGLGGKYLILPPGYDAPVPDGGYYVARSNTTRLLIMGRAFLENKSDPKPAVEAIKNFTKIYPYEAGGIGTPIAAFLSGKAKLGKIIEPPATVFHEGSGKVMNTVPPNDFNFYEMLNEIVQQEPATSLNPEQMGSVAAIGIIKDKSFSPDARMKQILTEAVSVANATSRSLFLNPRDKNWYYYPGSAWMNFLFVTGYEFETPIPEITHAGVKPFPATGYRQLDARTAFFYYVTGITPAMAMRVTGIGSQYLLNMLDADKNYFDGSKTYRVTLPKEIPEENFWSFTVYDNQTRSMLDTPQRYPRAGSQSYPSPAAEAGSDSVTEIYFSPTQPAGVKRGNWIQTDPKKGWFTILRLYSPLEPFFTKTWRPSEIELVP
ncbi:DUF1254 domain-containing protein [Methylorubrum extorquens]|uniref:DUF1254 domain-containing protein n=1 Tax=Methylorubrum extorquens TaxID=408 RepID=UPI000158FAB8|nr:DUF1254 domain-containing protein [Methylorubrum extorquens]ABY28688.1 protein of unknown function DUF1254 [Methylorubrum extorquens PA1]KQP85777.1 hypothetical protein ASF55_15665 [Methylobacterium sp. Leaf119]WIU40067.1 DUF1254 domain-containing protein [Methylorubrum extorquens]